MIRKWMDSDTRIDEINYCPCCGAKLESSITPNLYSTSGVPIGWEQVKCCPEGHFQCLFVDPIKGWAKR